MESQVSSHAELASELFRQGYNCSQAVFAAFSDVTGLDRETSLRLASSFGGGMGRMREICGVCSALFMVMGMKEGGYDPDDQAAKNRHYQEIQEIAGRFREQNGSLLCRELLASLHPSSTPESAPRTPDFYRQRPCLRFVETGAALLDEWLRKTAGL